MTPIRKPGGLAMLCDAQGMVLRVTRDELGMNSELLPGSLFPAIVDAVSVPKALAFLDEIRRLGAAFNWTMNCMVRGDLTSLHFAGCAGSEGLTVVAARSHSDIIRIYEELMRINNEQINALRQVAKQQAEQAVALRDHDTHLFDELSRLNNELANAQRELTRKNRELERVNELKNHFLGVASHDLRTPLNAILAYSDFIKTEAAGVLAAKHMEFLETIESSAEYMLSLVNNLLDISMIETGKLDLELWATDILSIVERNVEVNRTLAGRKGITLDFDHSGENAPIWIDRARIEQVLNNLIGNAVKFSHPGTMIRVELTQNEDLATISVRDQGQGIPSAELDALFKPFEKTSTRSTQGEQGAGLGLAIVKRIVEEHKGTITVESQVGIGTTFTVTLPAGRRRASGSASGGNGRGMGRSGA